MPVLVPEAAGQLITHMPAPLSAEVRRAPTAFPQKRVSHQRAVGGGRLTLSIEKERAPEGGVAVRHRKAGEGAPQSFLRGFLFP